MGLTSKRENLASYKTMKDQYKTLQRLQGRDLAQQTQEVQLGTIRQELFKAERAMALMERRKEELIKEQKQVLESKNKLVLKKEIDDEKDKEE